VECRVGKGSDDGDGGVQNEIEGRKIQVKQYLSSRAAQSCRTSQKVEGGKVSGVK
jgi:hypothetical protein